MLRPLLCQTYLEIVKKPTLNFGWSMLFHFSRIRIRNKYFRIQEKVPDPTESGFTTLIKIMGKLLFKHV